MPRVHLNCAMTLDGAIGLPGPAPLRISGPEDMARVHALRCSNDAILVGIGTVLADDPKLDVKAELLPAGQSARNPLRVVLDSRGRTPTNAQVLNARAPTLLMCAAPGQDTPDRVHVKSGRGGVDIGAALEILDQRGVRSVLVEGGSGVLGSFLESGAWHEWTIYVAPFVLGDPRAPRLASLTDSIALMLEAAARLGQGVLLTYRPAR